jgi:hypothetical protein
MKIIASAVAAAFAAAIPLAVEAQSSTPHQAPPGGWAQMQKARDDAKAAAFGDLGPAHRAQVQSIADQVNAGTLADLHAAAQQIDALLTPDEAKAVLVERDKMRAAMRARFGPDAPGGPPPAGESGGPPPPAVPVGAPPNAGPGAPPPGTPQGGPPSSEGRREGGRSGWRPDDAGGFLLQLAVTPDRMRALREQMRAAASPRPGAQ